MPSRPPRNFIVTIFFIPATFGRGLRSRPVKNCMKKAAAAAAAANSSRSKNERRGCSRSSSSGDTRISIISRRSKTKRPRRVYSTGSKTPLLASHFGRSQRMSSVSARNVVISTWGWHKHGASKHPLQLP